MKKATILKEQLKTNLHRETYRLLGEDINNGKISSFAQVFDYVSKTQLATDLKVNASGFIRLKADNGLVWRVEDISRFAELTGAEGSKVYELLSRLMPSKTKPQK